MVSISGAMLCSGRSAARILSKSELSLFRVLCLVSG